MSYPLGKSFRIEDIMKSEQGKYLTVTGMWHKNFSKLSEKVVVGGQSTNNLITFTHCEPLTYDGISRNPKIPVFSKVAF